MINYKSLSFYLSVLLVSFILAMNANQLRFNNYLNQSRYDNILYDYVVPKPGFDQVVNMKSEPHIEALVPFYQFNGSIKINNTNSFTTILVINDSTDTIHTNFSAQRLIKSIEETTHSVYIDFALANQANIKLGDQILMNFSSYSFTYTVTRIYETDNSFVLNNGVVMVAVHDELAQFITNQKFSYAGAYITSSQVNETSAYLSTYKPLGLLKDRELFDSQDAYEVYLSNFNAINYSNEIISIDHLASNTRISTVDKLLPYLLFSFSILVMLLTYIFPKLMHHKKNITEYLHKLEQGQFNKIWIIIKKRFISNFIITHCVLLISILVVMFGISKNIYPKFRVDILVTFYLGFIISFLLSHYQEVLMYRIYLRSLKKKAA